MCYDVCNKVKVSFIDIWLGVLVMKMRGKVTSLHRIIIMGKDKKLICSVEDKERLFKILQCKNNGIGFCSR